MEGGVVRRYPAPLADRLPPSEVARISRLTAFEVDARPQAGDVLGRPSGAGDGGARSPGSTRGYKIRKKSERHPLVRARGGHVQRCGRQEEWTIRVRLFSQTAKSEKGRADELHFSSGMGTWRGEIFPADRTAPRADSNDRGAMDDEVVPEELGIETFVKAGLAGGAACVKDIEDDWDDLHEKSCARGDKFYIDPSTGYMVMTKVNHLARGKCCGSGCRHCPFSHVNVRDKAARIQMPSMMHKPASGLAPSVTVLMWSGGKDSFLALRAMLRPGGRLHDVGPSGVVLLTTFDATTRMVAHQDVSARDVERQAKHLDVGLVGVPLHRNAGPGYVHRLRGALDVVRKAGCEVTALACGDLHLEHIRSWREEAVGRGLGVRVCYPVWCDDAGANYSALAEDLRRSGVPCRVTAVTEDRCERAGVVVGALYGPELAAAVVAAGADAFGENGEFHTLAAVWETTRERALGLEYPPGEGF